MAHKIAIYSLTAKGAELGRNIHARLGEENSADHFILKRYVRDGEIPFDSLRELMQDSFNRYDGHIFIAASGIVVRCIADLLKGKDVDPAVVVVDQEGQFAISLVSGHLGGANELARLVADLLGATPVITTATDCAGVPSVDLLARENKLRISDIGLIKHINSALLDGEKVAVYDPDGFFNLGGLNNFFYAVQDLSGINNLRCSIVVDWRSHDVSDNCLVLYPQCLTLGVGCRRGVGANEILELIDYTLQSNRVAGQSISCMGSIDAKSDEAGLLETAERLGLELHFFDAAQLNEIKVANPSGMVMKHMGVGGVCEAAAMKMANATEILIPKTKSARVTAALAKVVSKS